MIRIAFRLGDVEVAAFLLYLVANTMKSIEMYHEVSYRAHGNKSSDLFETPGAGFKWLKYDAGLNTECIRDTLIEAAQAHYE
jgi:hypothetical protein